MFRLGFGWGDSHADLPHPIHLPSGTQACQHLFLQEPDVGLCPLSSVTWSCTSSCITMDSSPDRDPRQKAMANGGAYFVSFPFPGVPLLDCVWSNA